jgi:hypothetical protein
MPPMVLGAFEEDCGYLRETLSGGMHGSHMDHYREVENLTNLPFLSNVILAY